MSRRSALVALPAVVVFAGHFALTRAVFVDDNFVFYRYASNWADGLGPVFNRGEHVEGFSSFLWTGLLALGARLGIAPETAAPALGLVCGVGCLLLLASAARAVLPGGATIAALAALALALSPAFANYARSGMDTTIFALVLLATVVAVGRHAEATRSSAGVAPAASAAAVSVVALVLVRAEGPVYAIALALASLALSRGALRARLLLLAIAVLATAAVVVARQAFYATWLPATVMAKGYLGHLVARHDLAAVGHLLGEGLRYEGLLVFVVAGLALAAAGVARRRDRRPPPPVTLSALALVVALAVALAAGGDWMPYRRLLVPVLPLLIVLGVWGVAVLAGAATRRRPAPVLAALTAVAGSALAVAAVGLAADSPRTKLAHERAQLEGLGRVLRSAPRPVGLLTNLAGALPYRAGSRTYVWDILGLTDLHNARHGQIFSPRFGRTDPAYDFSRPFDVFVSNSPYDMALLLAEWDRSPGRYRDHVYLSDPSWRAFPLFVVVRRDPVLVRRVEAYCGCRATPLTRAVRDALRRRVGPPPAPN